LFVRNRFQEPSPSYIIPDRLHFHRTKVLVECADVSRQVSRGGSRGVDRIIFASPDAEAKAQNRRDGGTARAVRRDLGISDISASRILSRSG
jgi:hypothetical protein